MNPWLQGFLIGLFVGANVGLLVLGLLVAAKDADAHLDPVSRRHADEQQAFWDELNEHQP